MDGFVHLHVHSEYSLLDGAGRIADLVGRAKELGMPALALTDHGNLYGAVEFYAACKDAGVKPILGLEAYISPTTRHDRSMGNITAASYHMILLAANATGWHNLLKLSSRAFLEGFYYRPRIDLDLLREFHEGLVCTTACLGGEVPSAYLAGQADRAEKVARAYLEIFGRERFFIEIQNQGLSDQARVNPPLVELAGRLGVGLVGTNDVHFLAAGDKPSHEVLTAISTGKTLAEGGALTYSPELWLKGPADMRQSLAAWPQAADNTLAIADRCDVKLNFKVKHLPRFTPPDGSEPKAYLRRLAEAGLRRRCGGEPPAEYVQRLERELLVIDGKGFNSYFLIVHDFVEYARGRGIPCGARGSGCATLLGYCLAISDVDPIRYGLLFERFTDPMRQEDPDIDMDICQEGRGQVIQYVRQKYGHVAQIITFGTLKARAVVRDVGRVLDMPLPEVDQLAKKVPDALNMTLEAALVAEPSLQEMIERDGRVRALFEHARKLEGLARHAGVHAAGVIIADEPLEGLVPLCKQTDSDDAITQWDGPTCEKAGLLKMDFLGLRTLTTIQRARQLVREETGKDLDPETLPLDDPAVFEIFCKGETDGIFQFESGGMKGVLAQMRPARIEDLIAANAMYRPGPIELIGAYCRRKNGAEPVPSLHPLVDGLLAETYGIMAYQEQVMQVLNKLGKFPLNTALTLIKAISKKKEKAIAAERPKFIAGAMENGIAQAEADRLFKLIEDFGGYGFNKAHSTRYAIVAYQTAYFKCYWPRQFLAALLTFESGDTDKVVQYMGEAKRMGVAVGTPDINVCGRDFSVDGQAVRFGLAAIKGLGDKAVESILAARQRLGRFGDLYHFCENVDLRLVNRSTVEALVKCGAFDALGAHRAAMLAALDRALELGGSAADDRRSGQMNFFGGPTEAAAVKAAPRFPDVEPLSEAQLLQAEKDTLGFYVTSHPLVKYGRLLDGLATTRCARLAELGDQTPVTLGCRIGGVRERMTKSGRSAGKKMAILSVEDLTGGCEAVVFAETYEQFRPLLVEDAIVFLVGKVDRRRDTPQMIVEQVIPMDQAIEQLAGSITVRLEQPPDRDSLARLGQVLRQHRGRMPVYLEVPPAGRNDLRVVVRLSNDWLIAAGRPGYEALCQHVGEERVRLGRRGSNGNGNGSSGFPGRYYAAAKPRQRPVFTPSGQGPG